MPAKRDKAVIEALAEQLYIDAGSGDPPWPNIGLSQRVFRKKAQDMVAAVRKAERTVDKSGR